MKKLLLTVTLIGTALFVGSPVQAQAFKDVPVTHTYYTEIEEMKQLHIINGYEDQTFRPTQSILRKHVASLIDQSIELPKIRGEAVFADVPKVSAYYDKIQALYMAGVVDGNIVNGKRYYNPDATLTRAQMAKMLALAYDLEQKGTASFSDVKTTDWAYPYINMLYSNDITTGNKGRFLPQNKVSRQHFAVFMYRTLASKGELSFEGNAVVQLEKWVSSGVAFAPGTYSPQQIPAGNYAFIPPKNDLLYFGEEIMNGDILSNEIFDTFGYVHYQGRGNVFTDGYLVAVTVVEKSSFKNVKAFYESMQGVKNYQADGMYKIGTDLAAGTYTLLSTEEGAYVSINDGPIGNGDILTNDIFTGSYQVTVQDGQYLFVSGARMQ